MVYDYGDFGKFVYFVNDYWMEVIHLKGRPDIIG